MKDLNSKNNTGPNPKKIQEIFSNVAKSYDTTNNAMTFGLAHLWRRKLVKLSGTPPNGKILDCATGTGDLALEFKKELGTKASVIGIDFCKEMLSFAPQKAKSKNLDVTFELGDVLNLKFEAKSFDTVTIAYGIRNVADTIGGITEMWRTLKPGGKLLILETGEGYGNIFSLLINIYTKHIVPTLGGLISRQKHAYSYLSSSSQAFPSKEKFLDLTKNLTNLKQASYKTLLFGASYIYILEKK